MSVAGLDLLSFLIAWPLAAAVLTALLGLSGRAPLARLVALGAGLLEACWAASFLLGLPAEGWMVDAPRHAWMSSLGASYHVGADGLSACLIAMTALLVPLVIVASWTQISSRVASFHAWLLVLEAALVGTFAARDLLCFYVFWEAVLIPMYFLIGIWGGPGRLAATLKFVIYTAVGSLLMLVAILAVAHRGGSWDFGLDQALAAGPLPHHVQRWAFAAFALAFAIKVPLFPFHTWLPQAHVEAPTGGSVLLAGILLKMGVYGFIRLAWPLFPDAAAEAAPLLGALAVAGILYGALMALAQEDLKKLVAYSSVSHLGYCMLGICSMRWAGALGGAFQMLSHAVTTGALFFMVGMLYERSHSRSLRDFGGLARKAPRFAVFLGLFVFASIGLPGLCGFAGEFPILAGAYQAHPLWAAAGALGVLLGAVYLLGAYQKIAFGPVRSPHDHFPDLCVREVLVLLPLLGLAVGLGVAPRSVMDRLQPGVAAVVREALR